MPSETDRPSRLSAFIATWLRLLVVCSLVGLLSSVHWVFDLFNHFRPNALIASLLFCGLTYFFAKKHLWLAVAITCVNGVILLMALQRVEFAPEFGTAEAGLEGAITVVSANVRTSNDEYAKAFDILTRDNADIIALTEVNDTWLRALEGLEEDYPYKIATPRSDNFGMAVYSKLPFKGALEQFGPYRLPLGKLDFGTFNFVVAHPTVPVSSTYVRDNRAYIEEIAAFAKETDQPTVIVGDLNTTVFSSAIHPLLGTGIQKVSFGALSYTWPTFLPILGIQLDHVFARDIPAARARVIEGIGSDHYPVEVRFELPK